MKKTALFDTGPDALAWMMGAAERENVREVPDSILMPRIEGDEEIGPASPALTRLLLCAHGVYVAVNNAHKASMESPEEHMAFHMEAPAQMHYMRDVYKALTVLQMITDLRECGKTPEEYAGIGVAKGAVLVGYRDDNTYQRALLLKEHRERQPVE